VPQRDAKGVIGGPKCTGKGLKCAGWVAVGTHSDARFADLRIRRPVTLAAVRGGNERTERR